jgi:hypothetical protein
MRHCRLVTVARNVIRARSELGNACKCKMVGDRLSMTPSLRNVQLQKYLRIDRAPSNCGGLTPTLHNSGSLPSLSSLFSTSIIQIIITPNSGSNNPIKSGDWFMRPYKQNEFGGKESNFSNIDEVLADA